MLSNTSCFPVLVKKFHVSSWLTALYTDIYSTGFKDTANNPARSPVHYHASHQLHQGQGLEPLSFQEILTRNVNRIWSFSTPQKLTCFPEDMLWSAWLNFGHKFHFFWCKESPLSKQSDRREFIHSLVYLGMLTAIWLWWIFWFKALQLLLWIPPLRLSWLELPLW